jgi:translation elongation factor EF-1alpha
MPWYDGPTITQMLDTFEPPKTLVELPLRFPVQDVYRFDERAHYRRAHRIGHTKSWRHSRLLSEQ